MYHAMQAGRAAAFGLFVDDLNLSSHRGTRSLWPDSCQIQTLGLNRQGMYRPSRKRRQLALPTQGLRAGFAPIVDDHGHTVRVQQYSVDVSADVEAAAEDGARLKALDRIGTLAPGKQADLVMIRASDLNMQPVHDPVSSAVFHTALSNIDSVMVAGQWKKRHGQLVGVELAPLLARLQASGQKITRAMGLAAA